MRSGMFFPPYGDTIGSIVVQHVNGYLVDVASGAIYPACVNLFEGKVVRIERKVAAPDQYILPGLIDSRATVESSHLSPLRFAEQAVVHGTTAVIADPTPLVGATGTDGMRYMREAARTVPLRFHYAVPSDVPSVGWKETKQLLSEDFVALGEVADHRRLIDEDPALMGKVEVANQLGKRVDGRAPGLRGFDLDRFMMAGVSADYGCTTAEEAEAKRRKGLMIGVREGSGERCLRDLMPFAQGSEFMLATGQLRARDLLRGHMDSLLRAAVAEGLDPVQAVRAATLWPAEHYGIPGGSLYVGSAGDLTVVKDLKEFKVLETWIGGEMVAKDGAPLFVANPVPPLRPAYSERRLSEVQVGGGGPVARVKVLEAGREAGWGHEDLPVVDGGIVADPSRDLLYLLWADPREDWTIRTGFVRGFGLGKGAIASSEVYGIGGIVGVGGSLRAVAEAVNGVAARGGGAVAVLGERRAWLDLPVGGLMSDRPAPEVAGQEAELLALTREMGSPLEDPFLTLASLGRDVPKAFQVERPVLVEGA